MKKINKSLIIFMALIFVMAVVLGNVTAKAVVSTNPTISRVGLGHPLIAGDSRTFTVTSATYVGKVQYRAFVAYGNHTTWTEITKGYTTAIDGKAVVALPATKAFTAGNYRVSVWVIKAGTVGIKKDGSGLGSYDSYKVSNLTCEAEDYRLGNSIGNINNKGSYVLNKDWIYTNTLGYEFIYKMKRDGTQKKKLNSQHSGYLNVTNKYIYYSDIQNFKLYRMNLDGSNIVNINRVDNIISFMVYDDYIYYSNHNDRLKIYRVKFDGSGRTKITNEPGGRYINIDGNYLYYSSGDDGHIYRVNLDGTNKKLISKDNCSYEILRKGVIYYINESDKYHLYRINVDGTECKKLNDDMCYDLNISGNVLYYSNGYDNSRMYATKIDGTLRRPVTIEPASYLNIVGDKIYYKTIEENVQDHSTSIINLDTNEIPNDPNLLGNLPGNINNEAFAGSDGKNIYMHDVNDKSGIYRYNMDYTNKFFVGSDVIVNYLSVSNGWIYYATTNTHQFNQNERIYKIKADGSGQRIELSANRAYYMTVAGDWIYYTTEWEDASFSGEGPIHKVRVDGSGEAYVDVKNYDFATYLNVSGDYIYYINTKDNRTIYKIKSDGTGREKILDETVLSLNVRGEYIYYSDNNGLLKRMPINGGSSVTLINSAKENFIVTNNKIYYIKLDAVYSSNLDGSLETLIVTNCNWKINIAGNYLYYKDDTTGGMNVIKVQ